MIRIITVVGARPQFIKAAAVSRAIVAHNQNGGSPIDERIIHTGQHYDDSMSRVFFEELHIPAPVWNLGVGSGLHGQQTGGMLEKIERVLLDEKPDWVLVYGDTNSTLAGALAASKLHVRIAHVEAGLRSYNRRMPEEINRVVADSLSTLLFCPSKSAVRNLAREGISEGVHVVGDVMYDSVLFNAALAKRSSGVLQRLELEPKTYYLATIHRAENTDDPQRLAGILGALRAVSVPVILPLHPRTRKTLGAALGEIGGNVRVIDPVPYLDMLMLERNARIILTDSGGVQKEAYWFGVPCVTLRDETEWVELVEAGWNRVVGSDSRAVLQAATEIEATASNDVAIAQRNVYGNGRAAGEIVDLLHRAALASG